MGTSPRRAPALSANSILPVALTAYKKAAANCFHASALAPDNDRIEGREIGEPKLARVFTGSHAQRG